MRRFRTGGRIRKRIGRVEVPVRDDVRFAELEADVKTYRFNSRCAVVLVCVLTPLVLLLGAALSNEVKAHERCRERVAERAVAPRSNRGFGAEVRRIGSVVRRGTGTAGARGPETY